MPRIRIRFSTSNPQDMRDDVLETIAKYKNICNYRPSAGAKWIVSHLGVDEPRTQQRRAVDRPHSPNHSGLCHSHDMIAGFPTETEEDHRETLSLMEYVQYDFGYMFFYSERPNTYAARKLEDDIPLEVKKRRLSEIIQLQNKHSLLRHEAMVGNTYEVLMRERLRNVRTNYLVVPALTVW